jgi:hypothetical protein
MSEESTIEEPQEQGDTAKEPISIYPIIATTMEQFAMIAWQKMGLQPDLVTGQIHKDLPEAKVAVDLAIRLAETLEPQLDEEDKRKVQNLIRDLRLNFVEQSKS